MDGGHGARAPFAHPTQPISNNIMSICRRDYLRVIASAAKQSIPATPKKEWIASSQVLLAMTENTVSRSRRRFARDLLQQSFRPSHRSEGAGRTRGAQCTRGLVCAGVNKKLYAAEPQVQADHPAFPAQWFYGLYVISPGTGLFCPRHFRRNCALRKLSASVGAPGPHDFAVRFRRARLASPSASTATRLTSVTIAKRPSWRGGMAMDLQLIWGRTKQEYFCGKDWTENSQNDPSGKSIVVLLFYCSESSSSSRVAAA